jgi:DNA-binding transcriptional LysR family regulator
MMLARELNFSRAAELLHISQPALTKRIQNLEEILGQSLFLRLRSGLRLTDPGRVLQRHAASVERQEQELIDDLVGGADGISGFFRLASFSSCLRSVLVPAIGGLLRENPRLSCQFIKAEADNLQDMLIEGKIDYCISLSECERMGIENVRLGTERNVLIESAQYEGREDCYIDHDPRDNFTERFFLVQTGATVPKMLRAYFDDIYGLIDAVSQGIGRAVVPLHLLRPEHKVRMVPGFRPYDVPVFLHYHQRHYYTKMQQAVVDAVVYGSSQLYDMHEQTGTGMNAVADDALIVARRRASRHKNVIPLARTASVLA